MTFEELKLIFDENFFSSVLPFLLVFVIIVRNNQKTKQNIAKLNDRCSQGCQGCQRRPLCRKPNKK